MDRKWLLCLLMATNLQAGCWTVYDSREARQPAPIFPANPDGVCPEIAMGVYSSSVPEGGGGLIGEYFGTVFLNDEHMKGIKVPESWPQDVVSVEKTDFRTLKIGTVGYAYKEKIRSLVFVKNFKKLEVRNIRNDVVEAFCNKGVYYGCIGSD